MKKLAYLFTTVLILSSAMFTQVKSQEPAEFKEADDDEPKIVDTWDAELGFCHGEATDCYEMIEV
jgi:hypothetical protein